MQESITLSIGIVRHDQIRQLSSIDLRILDEILFLIGKKQDPDRIKQRPTHPGLKYLAMKAECSYYTASRAVSKLYRLGIIWKRQLKSIKNEFMTNAYFLGSKIMNMIRKEADTLLDPKKGRLRENATISESKYKENCNKVDLFNIINRVGAKFGFEPVVQQKK